jgi:trehalose synthase
MSLTTSEIEAGTLGLHSLDNYAPLIGAATVERILNKAERLRTLHAVHISSTFYGGGVTEILTPLTLMMECPGHRNRLAHDPGDAGILQLHQEAPQHSAG